MGFDILAIEPAVVTDEEFPAWWDRQSAWSEQRDYNDPAGATPAIQLFMADLAETFPPMNGPLRPSEERLEADPELDDRLSDYSIGRQFVFADFGFSVDADENDELAERRFMQLAYRHGLAIVLTTGDRTILRPDRDPLPDWVLDPHG
ncbi:hypothetical protein [Amnibacterium setariae]|uniref:Uncharacterized protein n=1 Tax=Amnibacterium setariae TaxID=2306585 RepID=A0A3A1TUC5_9MICO|nr:hypothetical protein [Amnibacterium setariae]RIX27853.1 hypothetical protein D1781_09985 [Amnibacterium setariae]